MTLGVDPGDRIPSASAKPASKWPRQFGTFVRIGVVVVVLGAAGVSSWPYLREHFLTSAVPSGPVPVIGPGDEPIKEAPKQPGGMQVPDQDKIILNGAAARPKVEQLLPPPPAPLPSPMPAAPAPVTTASQPSAPAKASPPVSIAPTPPPAAPPQRKIEAPLPQVVTAAPPRAPTATVAAPPQKPAPAATVSNERVPSQLAQRGWFVQLGAVSSTGAAQAEWTRLKHANADLLTPLSANAVRVERSSGVIYRIEAGPLADAGAASHLCRSLQKRHVACIVLRP